MRANHLTVVVNSLIKIVASFLSNVEFVCVNCVDQNRVGFNVCGLGKHKSFHVSVMDNSMPRFYFHLASKDSHIADDSGKELATLNDAYEHARKLIHKILFHVGHEDAEAWKVVILNDEHDAQITIPFIALKNALKNTVRTYKIRRRNAL